MTVNFTLKAINLETVEYHELPDCLRLRHYGMSHDLSVHYGSSMTFVSISSYIFKPMSGMKREGFSAGKVSRFFPWVNT